jgi:hypothetical protein
VLRLVVALLVSLVVAPPHAHGGSFQIDFRAPPGCPDAAALHAAIAKLLGAAADTAEFRVRVDVEQVAGTWRLRLTTRDAAGATGERELRGASCAEVVDGAALIVALAVDPAAVARASARAETDEASARRRQIDDDEAPPAGSVLTPRARPPAPGASTRSAAARPPWGGRIRGFVAADWGSLPSAAPGLGVAAAVTRGRLRGEVGLAYWLQQRAPASADPGAGGDLFLVTGTTRACAIVTAAALAVCGGLEAGSMRGRGYGVDQPASGAALWLAPTLGVGRAWRWRSFGLWTELALLAPLTRAHFTLDTVGEVHRAAPLSVRAVVGGEVTLR